MSRKIIALLTVLIVGLCSAGVTHAAQFKGTSTAKIESSLNYLIYTPDDYAASDTSYPLVVWLHGGDQGGTDIEKVRASGLPKLVEGGKAFPFLVFAPQNPSEELLYPIERVEAALQEVMSAYRVDPTRVYVVGYSRGALGAWAMAEQFPQTFAAVVPIAGGGNRHYLSRTNENAAFWVFHGTKDDVIPLSDSVVLYERLVTLKRNARLSVLEDVDHPGVEGAALNDPELWHWILQQRLAPGPL